MPKPWIRSATQAGTSVSAGQTHVMPVAHSVTIQPAGLPFGVIWNRPLSLVIRTADGKVREVPVRDLTRRRQVLWLAAGLLGSLFLWYILRK
jgi:hypothetical protein